MVQLTATPIVAVALGAMLGLGLWLIAASVPRIGRARLNTCRLHFSVFQHSSGNFSFSFFLLF